ncbi:MAG: dihydroorotate dehydrogenase electron transfer subunit [Desulfobacterales bacterium]|nr:dihydroorotate dehydrogenase electron transfer subunit [Desulfobacterales bacterium]MBF0395702.1 dihydroorotate dehydrogenase electron transfer subunit [Desulfobacterales bacterium]
MFQEKTKILWNELIKPSYYRLGLKCNNNYSFALPGQFIMLYIPDDMPSLLRRPFSIHKITSSKDKKGDIIEILYKVIGKSTQKLSNQKQDMVIDIIAPLGKGFFLSDSLKRVFIVAGGIGIAPMVFLASFFKEKLNDTSGWKLFLGGKTEQDLLCEQEFINLNMPVYKTTEDGSAGQKGFITQELERQITVTQPELICACGPMGMLKSVSVIAEKYCIPCQVSMETMMACGMGACLACAVEKKESEKYFHVCLDGPVFDAASLTFK